jgi:hypothetical protein
VETFVAQWLISQDTSVCQQKVEKLASPLDKCINFEGTKWKKWDSGTQLNLGCEL